MLKDSITWGENYDIAAQAKDADGAVIPIDGTWSAAVRVCRKKIGGQPVFDSALTIANNTASATIDTAADGWAPGIYFYDIRLTDETGEDQWTETIELTLDPRCTEPSI